MARLAVSVSKIMSYNMEQLRSSKLASQIRPDSAARLRILNYVPGRALAPNLSLQACGAVW